MKASGPRLRRRSHPSIGTSGRLIDRLAGPFDALLNLLFEEAGTGILVMDLAGKVVRANETLHRMVARRIDLSPGSAGMDVFCDAERGKIWRNLQSFAEDVQQTFSFAARLQTADLDPDHRIDVTASLLHEADSAVSGLILRLFDITDQKRMEAQLAHGQKMQAVGQLAGGIAHDFNNLLTAIGGAAEVIFDNTQVTDPEIHEDARDIRASVARGAALVRQLLAFGRQQTLQPCAIAVNPAIEELATLMRRVLGGQIRLELDLQLPGRTVRADPTQLDQVLLNLALNARDAMANGGTLTLRSGHITLYRPLSRGPETIPPGRYVMIEVQDTGTGIPAHVLPRIFDPFFTTRRDHGGNGLGLSTVHGIVRQSDGFLAVESEPGAGTRFRIYLPRYEQEAQPVLPLPIVAEKLTLLPTGQRTVLLVEDEDLVRRLAGRALTQRGWQVLAADSADSAMALLKANPGQALAAVISDVVMPGIDGPALVRLLRLTRPELPALLVSGYADETLRAELASSGICFLAKPYGLAEMTNAMARIVSKNVPVVPA